MNPSTKDEAVAVTLIRHFYQRTHACRCDLSA